MIWLTWRQYRSEILILGILLSLTAITLLVTGTNIISFAHHVGNTNCSAQHCIDAQGELLNYIQSDAFGNNAFYIIFELTLLAFPLLIGMFVGTHTLARELEQGTYRLAWTQSISWSRWLLLKICAITCFALSVTAILYGLLAWWKAPLSSLSLHGGFNLWDYMNYDIWSVAAIAYTLFALALGICAGTILRKTVPAIAVTLVIFITLRILIEIFWRPYFLPPVVLLTPFSSSTYLPQQALPVGVGSTVDRQGNQIDPYNVCKISALPLENNTSSATLHLNIALPLANITLPVRVTHTLSGGGPTTPQEQARERAYEQCTLKHGFQDKYVYQPADRFWLFQAIESGIYVLLSIFLLALTFWWTKYRIIGK